MCLLLAEGLKLLTISEAIHRHNTGVQRQKKANWLVLVLTRKIPLRNVTKQDNPTKMVGLLSESLGGESRSLCILDYGGPFWQAG